MPDGHHAAFLRRGHVLLEQFGPAQVTAVLRDEVEVCYDGETCRARIAVAPLYQPAVGDEILLLTACGEAYVIGVLSASAPATLHVPGDLRLCAPHGTISLLAQSVEIDAAQATLRAGTLSIAATRLRESYDEVRRVVRGLLDVEIGELRAAARGLLDLAARRIRARSEEDVQIDGKQIHIG